MTGFLGLWIVPILVLQYLCFLMGTTEEFNEKEVLLTELTEMFSERNMAQERNAQAGATDRALALKLRDEACSTLGQKTTTISATKPQEDASSRKKSGSFMDSLATYMAGKEED